MWLYGIQTHFRCQMPYVMNGKVDKATSSNIRPHIWMIDFESITSLHMSISSCLHLLAKKEILYNWLRSLCKIFVRCNFKSYTFFWKRIHKKEGEMHPWRATNPTPPSTEHWSPERKEGMAAMYERTKLVVKLYRDSVNIAVYLSFNHFICRHSNDTQIQNISCIIVRGIYNFKQHFSFCKKNLSHYFYTAYSFKLGKISS